MSRFSKKLLSAYLRKNKLGQKIVKHYQALLVVFLSAVIGLGLAFLPKGAATESKSPEIEAILALDMASEQQPHLLKLLERVGAEEAQEQLLRSGLPFTGETHLLVHTIGDWLYKKFGSGGLRYCKDYFLSACYHQFIINDLGDNGLEGLAETVETCGDSGRHVLAQCAHASGHGFVAWNDYDLLSALRMCDELGELAQGISLFNCHDGVFMENLYGVHGGGPSPKRWIKGDDPYYPCNDPRIPEKYLGGCWSNQASVMFQMYKADLTSVAQGCDGVEDPDYRRICYDNFARQIHPLTQGKTDKAFEFCGFATGTEWQNYCLYTMISAAFSVGDQEKMPFEVCERMTEPAKLSCYSNLFAQIKQYPDTQERVQELCGRILESDYRQRCLGQ